MFAPNHITIRPELFESPAMKTAATEITWGKLAKRIQVRQLFLESLGLKRGDKCAILAEPSIEYVEILFAMWAMGIIAVPLNTRLPKSQVVEMLDGINCRHLFSNEKFGRLNQCVIHSFQTIDNVNEPHFPEINFQLDTPATIIFTSGSTGHGKACLHSVANHHYNALGSNDNIELQPGDSWMLSLPLYHVAGIAILFRCLLSGAAITIPSTERSLDDNLALLKPTHLSLVPTQLQQLLEIDKIVPVLTSTKAILLGGSAIPVSLIKQALNLNLPIYKSYGSTEMSSQITTTPPHASLKDFETSGKILPFRELNIAEDGEILVRGKTLFQGYVNSEALQKSVDDNGWYHTSDLGMLDQNGFLTVLGRKDNMFISGGENIHPEEIERVLEELEIIEQAIVVPVSNDKFGQRPVAFVQLKANAKLSDMNIDDLIPKLAKFKIPDHFFEWPKSENGFKPNRKTMQKLAEQLLSD